MSDETKKAFDRRYLDPLFRERAFRGIGIDIGSGGDPMSGFPHVKSVEPFDVKEGDASRILDFRSKESYDFVYSSNCLEHLDNPIKSVLGWWELVKRGGYLVFTIPDEDIYEQGLFPSRWNPQHKNSFTIWKLKSWSSASVNVIDIVRALPSCRILRLGIVDTNYNYGVKNQDQTRGDAEAFIEVVLQKT